MVCSKTYLVMLLHVWELEPKKLVNTALAYIGANIKYILVFSHFCSFLKFLKFG